MQRVLILVGFSCQLYSYFSSLLKSCEVLRIERENYLCFHLKKNKKAFHIEILLSSKPLGFFQKGNLLSIWKRFLSISSDTSEAK